MTGKPRVIVITDGDMVARGAVETAARNIGGRCISLSAGSPTWIDAEELIRQIRSVPHDPVLVMVDDHGSRAKGPGEEVLEQLARSDEIRLVGAVAVASNTAKVMGVPVLYSIDASGRLIEGAVDKEGVPEPGGNERVEGDTVDILNAVDVPIVVGIGDPGKMNKADATKRGARITTKAVEAVLQLWEETQLRQGGPHS